MLSVKSISFPSWPTNVFDYPVDPASVMALVRDNFEAPAGESLKGVVLLQYQDDSFLRAALGQQVLKETLAVPLIGGIVNDMLSSKLDMEKKTTFACGWAVFGSDRVKVSSIALDLQSPAENLVHCHIAQHFQGASDGFMLILSKTKGPEYEDALARIRAEAPKIPVIGWESIGQLSFQGYGVANGTPDFIPYSQDPSATSNFKLICLLVAY
jgi:hypothetical protein